MPKVKKGACASNRKSVGDVQERPLRERVTHLLALRPYKRPDLMLRLQKDGLSEEGKDMLDSVLMEVIFLLFYMKYTQGMLLEQERINNGTCTVFGFSFFCYDTKQKFIFLTFR